MVLSWQLLSITWKACVDISLVSCLVLSNEIFLCATLSGQVCVVHSVEHGPVISEYSVSGTTFAPSGIIFDSSGTQVLLVFVYPCSTYTRSWYFNYSEHLVLSGEATSFMLWLLRLFTFMTQNPGEVENVLNVRLISVLLIPLYQKVGCGTHKMVVFSKPLL